jgi:hypothetical protein
VTKGTSAWHDACERDRKARLLGPDYCARCYEHVPHGPVYILPAHLPEGYGLSPVCVECVTPEELNQAWSKSACKGCNRIFWARQRGLSDLRCTCSDRCQQRALRMDKRVKRLSCLECGMEFKSTRGDARYCSSPCRQKAYRHRNNRGPPHARLG